MTRTWIALSMIALLALPASAAAKDILIFGGDGHKEFLGCLSCSKMSGDSVFNEFSKHGWSNGFGTWSEFGKFGSEFGNFSACNEFASDPPVLVDADGNFYGRLTISEVKSGSICGATGSERACIALKVMCAHKD